MKKILIYARVSTDDKQDFGRQITELEKAVKTRHGLEVDYEIISEKISGYKLNDGSQLENLLNEIQKNPNKYMMLYVWELSRLGRNPLETRNRIEFLLSRGITIYVETLKTVLNNNETVSSSITKMILLLLLEFSHIEAETTKLRVKSGLLQSARDGKAGGGNHLPYGFKKDGQKRLVICDEESIIIKRIFDLYKKGNGTKRISTILNEDRVLTRYNKVYNNRTINFSSRSKNAIDIKWSDKQIYDILKNTIYKGERRFKNEIFSIPSIVDPQLFDDCNLILRSKFRKTDVKHIFILKDLIVCSCGRNFIGTNKRDEKVYKCSSRLQTSGSCGCRGINIPLIESSIFHLLLCSSHLVDFLKSSKQLRNEIQLEADLVAFEIKDLENALKSVKKKQSVLLDNTLDEFFDKKLIEQKTNLINHEIKKLTDKLSIKNYDYNNKISVLNKKFETNYDIIFNCKNDRQSLKNLFGEIVEKIIVISTEKDYTIIDVIIKVLDKSSIKFRIKLFNGLLRMKVKRYIYSVESAIVKTPYNGKEVFIPFERSEYVSFNKLNDYPLNDDFTISYEKKEIEKEDFLYEQEMNTSNVFSMLKIRFVKLFSEFLVHPIELTDNQLIFI